MNIIYGLIVGLSAMLGGQYTPSGPVFPAGGGCTFPVSDNFPGVTLSAKWTQTTASGGGPFVPIIASSGSAVSTGGGEGLAIYTGCTFPVDMYSQGAITYSGGGFTGPAITTVGGSGFIYLVSNSDVVQIANGVVSSTVVSSCGTPTSGHLLRLAWTNSTGTATVTDQTTGGTVLCTASGLTLASGAVPAIFIDGPVATDKIATYTAD